MFYTFPNFEVDNLNTFCLREGQSQMTIFTKEPKVGFGTSGSISKNSQFSHFLENVDIIQCRNTPHIKEYPEKVIKVVWNDGLGQKWAFGDLLVDKNDLIWRMVENRHLTFPFFLVKSFKTIYILQTLEMHKIGIWLYCTKVLCWLK